MKSKYKAYPSYKDSGVVWMGEIPEHWEVGRIKNSAMIFNGATPKSIVKEYWDGDISWIGPADMGKINSRNIFKGARDITFSGYSSCGTLLVPKGSVILSSRAPIGKVAIAGKALCTNQGCKSLVINQYFSNIFIFYILVANREHLNLLGRGTTFLELSAEELSSFNIPILPLQEQQAIANYLDKATAKIDTLIEKQTKLIELLKEKRQAVTSTAVTRGLDSTVAMKDSGVAWLGEIPEGWEVKKLKYILALQTEKVTIVKQQVIALENIESWSGKLVDTDSEYKGEDVAFEVNDILFGKLRPYLAKVYKCSNSGVAFGDILVYRPDKDTVSQFAFYTMISEVFIDIVDGSTYGSKMPRASVEFVSNMPVAIPAKKEQQQIANYLDQKTQTIDTLITKSTQAIALLKERRTALISAVVTGKIDVRDYDKGEI